MYQELLMDIKNYIKLISSPSQRTIYNTKLKISYTILDSENFEAKARIFECSEMSKEGCRGVK